MMEKMKKWFSNYWYHYKWVTIIVLFFATVFGIGVYQMATKDTYDINILYTGPILMNEDQTKGIEDAFASVLPRDFNSDDEKSVLVNRITVLSDEQLAAKQEEAKKENDKIYYDLKTRKDSISQVTTLFATGETTICLMDPYMYNMYLAQDAFVSLEEVLGEVPEYARDAYSVNLLDTPFGQYFEALQVLPEDTVLCIRKEAVFSGGSKKKAGEQYQFDKEVFEAIFEFTPPEL
jgi:hypothetical protein